MGQGFSKGNNVVIRTEKQSYETGEVLQGAVALNAVEPVEVDHISVAFKGKESVWVQRTQSNGTTTTTYTDRKRFTIYNVDVPLVPEPGTLQPGQYQYNFSVQIPDSVPPTFHERGSSGGMVYYTLKAVVKRSGRFASNITSKTRVIVHDGGRLLSPHPEQDEVHQQIMNCCFFTSGEAALKVSVDSNTIRGGDCLDVHLTGTSKSTAPFKKLKVCLRSLLSLSTSGDPIHRIARTRKHTVAKEERDFHLNMGQVKEYTVQLPIPAPPAVNLIPTYKGHLMHSYYVLEVEVLTRTCVKNLKVVLPIVCVPKMTPVEAVTAPKATDEEENDREEAVIVDEWKPTHVYTPKDVASMTNANTAGPVWRRKR